MDDYKAPSSGTGKKSLVFTSSIIILAGLAVGGYFAYKKVNQKSGSSSTTSAAPLTSKATTAPVTSNVSAVPVVAAETSPNYVSPWVQSEIMALRTSVANLQTLSGTTNYLCPLNTVASSGQCVSIDNSGQIKAPLVPFAKMTGGGAAIGFTSGAPLILPKSYVEGGMTYLSSTGQVVVPWSGRYELKCMITLDINKMGYVSLARNGTLYETYGRLYQNNASDSSNGYIGSNTFALPAKEKISLIMIKQGTNTGSIQGNFQDTWWSIRYIGPIVQGESV